MSRTMPRIAIALAALALPLAACGPTDGAGPATSISQQLSTPRGQAAALGSAYALAKAGFAIYAVSTVADPAVVAAVGKAFKVADVAIPKAQADILAATSQDGLTAAVKAGYDALAVLEVAMQTYGVKAAAAPAPKPAG